MEKVIYNLVFNRKKRLNAEGKALIQVEAYLNKAKEVFLNKKSMLSPRSGIARGKL